MDKEQLGKDIRKNVEMAIGAMQQDDEHHFNQAIDNIAAIKGSSPSSAAFIFCKVLLAFAGAAMISSGSLSLDTIFDSINHDVD